MPSVPPSGQRPSLPPNAPKPGDGRGRGGAFAFTRALAVLLPGKTERRLAMAILFAALLPLAAALYLASALFGQASAIWFNPEVGKQLDRGVEVYKDYVRAIKDGMRHETEAIAADDALRDALRRKDPARLHAALTAIRPRFPDLVELAVRDGDGRVLARHDRGHPVDSATERSLEVARPIPGAENGEIVVATFAVDRRRVDELETSGNVVTTYHQLEQSRTQLYRGYLQAFAALLGITMFVTLVVGIILARGVTRRINRLATAIDLVGKGDLAVRVPVTGSDELTELARTFNRMLGEMAQSRARIEFLQRIGAWQAMAQRLAHEIKNPLTPIQLAVQECHRKYAGDDPRFRALLDTTLEIVQEEVGTLRRLVGDFSRFARLPHAELREASLREFLRECSETIAHLDEAPLAGEGSFADAATDGPNDGDASERGESLAATNVAVRWELPEAPLDAAIDRQMLRRVVVNLVKNAVQAIRDARATDAGRDAAPLGRVVVSAHADGDGVAIAVDDDGPGVPEDRRARIFDPYYTTKSDGTGLGLAIVKKIVVEHGGSIDVETSARLGGARFVVHLPDPHGAAAAGA